MPYLISRSHDASNSPFELTETDVVIGRHPDCELLIDDSSVSRQHARISFVDGDYYVEDLGSRNGTFVSSAPIQKPMRLTDGAMIEICGHSFEFVEGSKEPSAKSLLERTEKAQVRSAVRVALRTENTNYRGERDDWFMQELSDPDGPIRQQLESDFFRVVTFNLYDQTDEAGGLDVEQFLVYAIGRMDEEFGLGLNLEKIHSQMLAQILKDEKHSLFCFLGVERLAEADFRLVREFSLSQHRVLYFGKHEFLSDRAYPINEIRNQDPDEEGALTEQIFGAEQESVFKVATHHRVKPKKMLAAIRSYSDALHSAASVERILELTSQQLVDVFEKADLCQIYLADGAGDIQLSAEFIQNQASFTKRQVNADLVHEVLQTGQSKLDCRPTSVGEATPGTHAISHLLSPLTDHEGRCLGAIALVAIHVPFAFPFHSENKEDLEYFAKQCSLAIRESQLRGHARQLSPELKLAADIQQSCLPQQLPQWDHYSFSSFYQARESVGGDFFDFVDLGQDKLGVVIGDVVGFGIPAAMLMAKITTEIRHALRDTPLTDAVNQVNQSLIQLKVDRFATLVLGVLDFESDRFTFINAGHLPPIHLTSDQDAEQIGKDSSGLPIGILDEFEYEITSCELRPGDRILMYTDGITEAMDASGKMLGEESIIQALRARDTNSVTTIGDLVQGLVRDHIGSAPPMDDMCLVCFGRE